jgi:nitrogen fixation NifU-like protein
MSELDDLYQEVIFDHHRAPRNFRVPEHATGHIEGHNPLCGDRLTIYVDVEGDVIREIGFQGAGCAISRASASLMTESVKGKSRAEVLALFERVHRMLVGEPPTDGEREELGKLAALSGIAQFPVRVKCASLAWHTLRAALQAEKDAQEAGAPVTTE